MTARAISLTGIPAEPEAAEPEARYYKAGKGGFGLVEAGSVLSLTHEVRVWVGAIPETTREVTDRCIWADDRTGAVCVFRLDSLGRRRCDGNGQYQVEILYGDVFIQATPRPRR